MPAVASLLALASSTALLQLSLRGTAQGSAFTAAVARAPPPYSGFTNWVDARITLAGALIGADIAASVNNAAAAGDNLGATIFLSVVFACHTMNPVWHRTMPALLAAIAFNQRPLLGRFWKKFRCTPSIRPRALRTPRPSTPGLTTRTPVGSTSHTTHTRPLSRLHVVKKMEASAAGLARGGGKRVPVQEARPL